MADSGRIPVFTAEVQGGRCVSASLLLQLPEKTTLKGLYLGSWFQAVLVLLFMGLSHGHGS